MRSLLFLVSLVLSLIAPQCIAQQNCGNYPWTSVAYFACESRNIQIENARQQEERARRPDRQATREELRQSIKNLDLIFQVLDALRYLKSQSRPVSSSSGIEWVLVATNAELDIYIAPASVDKVGNIATVWNLIDIKKYKPREADSFGERMGLPPTRRDELFWSAIFPQEYDCTEKRMREPGPIIAYSERMKQGTGAVVVPAKPEAWSKSQFRPGSAERL